MPTDAAAPGSLPLCCPSEPRYPVGRSVAVLGDAAVYVVPLLQRYRRALCRLLAILLPYAYNWARWSPAAIAILLSLYSSGPMPIVDAPPLRARAALTRREALGYAWLVSLAGLAVAGLRLSARFARPSVAQGQYGGVFDLGPVAALPVPGGAPRHEPAGRFWLVNTPAGLLSLHKACTHLACLCEWDEQNRQFVCPCHGSRFADDGTHLAGPATRSLDRFALRIETPAGGIVAATDPRTGAPLPVPATLAPMGSEDLRLVVDTGRVIQGAPVG